MVFSGKMEKNIPAKSAEKSLDEVLSEFLNSEISETQLEKIKNQSEAMKTYESIQVLNRAMNLAYFAHLGDPGLYWQEFEAKGRIQADQIQTWAGKLLRPENSSVIYYQSQKV